MNKKVKKVLLQILDLAINIVIIVGLVFIIQKWLIAPFDVSGASMCDTLNFLNNECINGYGEKIIINEATYFFNNPERGDIVVFRPSQQEEKYFIKRVIGLPGETIEIKDGKVYITKKEEKNSFELKEDYLNAENRNNTKTYFSDFTVFTVPEGQYFMLGDNRRSSTDSRSCFKSSISESCKNHSEEAFVDKSLIRGKAWVVWWPISSIRIVHSQKYNQPSSESLEEK